MGTAGTFPTVLADTTYVVKLFGPLFGGYESAEIERTLYLMLAADPAIPAPKMIASGRLDPNDGCRWEYIVSSQLPGESYGAVRERLHDADRRDMTRFIADVARRIHHLNPAAVAGLDLPLAWESWDTFLTGQLRFCTERHRAWGTLPEALIEQIATYLVPLPLPQSEQFIHLDRPAVLHCDLTVDHILGEWCEDRWIPTGIIDFGDSRVGDPVYDLVALHTDCFGGDKHLLLAFLDRYDFRPARQPDFVYRAMCMTLLHEFNVLETVFIDLPTARKVASLDDLATLIWDVNA